MASSCAERFEHRARCRALSGCHAESTMTVTAWDKLSVCICGQAIPVTNDQGSRCQERGLDARRITRRPGDALTSFAWAHAIAILREVVDANGGEALYFPPACSGPGTRLGSRNISG